MLSNNRLSEIKDNLINNITHELRTPITTISIAAEAMESLSHDGKVTTKYLSTIRYQATRMSGLIDTILNEMIDHNHLRKSFTPINLGLLVINFIRHSKFNDLYINNNIVINTSGDDMLVLGDDFMLENVISNLLDNAVKYGNDQPKISIVLGRGLSTISLGIVNEGLTIPKIYLTKIFDRFFRVPTGNMHNVKGYGLGLNYVKEIVRQHKGTIEVASSNNLTKFIINLPQYKDGK